MTKKGKLTSQKHLFTPRQNWSLCSKKLQRKRRSMTMLLFAFVCGCRFATAFLSNIHRLEHNNNPLVPRSDGYYSAWKSEERLPPTQAVSIRSFFSAVSQSKPKRFIPMLVKNKNNPNLNKTKIPEEVENGEKDNSNNATSPKTLLEGERESGNKLLLNDQNKTDNNNNNNNAAMNSKNMTAGQKLKKFPRFSDSIKDSATMEPPPPHAENYVPVQYGIFGKASAGAKFLSLPSNAAARSSSLAQNRKSKAPGTLASSAKHKDFTIQLPNKQLTLTDLEAILRSNGYDLKKKSPYDLKKKPSYSNAKKTKAKSSPDDSRNLILDDQDWYGEPNNGHLGASTVTLKTKSGVAFPQPSVLNYKCLRRGTAISGGFLGMILATTVLPNLWLMGVLIGSIYGYEITNPDKLSDNKLPTSIVPRQLIASGRILAKFALQLYDHYETLWFLYKTGQLSYEYYKTYEGLDQRFAIQSKIDAWNARFQEGKIKFDSWEQQNEIGRTVLAGLRTAWLVDEKVRKKRNSRYRVVQSLYDVKNWVLQRTKKLLSLFQSSSWKEFWMGLRQDMQESGWEAVGTRIGAVIASLIAINVMGALFALSATFVSILAVLVAVIWPSWVPELVARIGQLTEETRARGRGDDEPLSTSSGVNTAKLLKRYDKNKYHYFKRLDGSKRYYRSGQSVFGRSKLPVKNNKNFLPWTKDQQGRRESGKEEWGILSGFFSEEKKK